MYREIHKTGNKPRGRSVRLSEHYNMVGFISSLWIGVTLVLSNVLCDGDIVSVISRVDDLQEDVFQLKTGIFRMEEKVIHQIDTAKISLRSELKQHISEHVIEAIAGILQSESIEEMVRSQVITEVRQLKRGNHQMKRQLNRMLMSLNNVREEVKVNREANQKCQRKVNEMNITSKCVVDKKILKRDLDDCDRNILHCKQQTAHKEKEILKMKQSLNMLNQTCHLQKSKIDLITNPLQTTTTSPGTTTTTPATTTSTPATTTLVTIPKPEEEKSRIIIAPMWSGTQHQFRQLNIDSNIVTIYQLRSLKTVDSVVYVSKLKKLLIGLYSPNKIVSSNLDSYDWMILRENVRTQAMAIDEEREIVFMTTVYPEKTISRMTTHGKEFTVIIDLIRYGSWIRSIAVNTKEKKIYACNIGKVFMVTYDGRVLQTLATGSQMFAVTLDNTGGILYFNDDKKLMKMSLSQNVSEIVTTLSVIPRNFRFYRNKVYFSSYRSSNGTIGAVETGYNAVPYTLQTISLQSVSYYAICLV